MTNNEVLNRAESTIDALEAQFGILAELAADAGTAEQTVKSVASEITALHSNASGLEMKGRSNRLRDLNSTLELHKSDLKHLQAAVDDQKRRVIEAGGIARQMVQGIWSAAHLQRRSNAVEMIRATFDLRKCPVPVEGLALCERRYLETRDVEYFSPRPHGLLTTGLLHCANYQEDLRRCAESPKTRRTLIWRLFFPSRRQLNQSQRKKRRIQWQPNQHPADLIIHSDQSQSLYHDRRGDI